MYVELIIISNILSEVIYRNLSLSVSISNLYRMRLIGYIAPNEVYLVFYWIELRFYGFYSSVRVDVSIASAGI